jgi:hypothetical protein
LFKVTEHGVTAFCHCRWFCISVEFNGFGIHLSASRFTVTKACGAADAKQTLQAKGNGCRLVTKA